MKFIYFLFFNKEDDTISTLTKIIINLGLNIIVVN